MIYFNVCEEHDAIKVHGLYRSCIHLERFKYVRSQVNRALINLAIALGHTKLISRFVDTSSDRLGSVENKIVRTSFPVINC